MSLENIGVRPIHENIFFKFTEPTGDGRFNQISDGGIHIVEHKEKQLEECRWGKVLAVGPEVPKDVVEEGDYILVLNLQWTNMFNLNNIRMWMTNFESLVGIADKNDLPTECVKYNEVDKKV